MKAMRVAYVGALVLALALGAVAQDNGNGSGSQNNQTPVLKTRPPADSSNTPQPQQSSGATMGQSGAPVQVYGGPPNAIPDGTRVIIKLKDTLDTKKMEQG